MKLRDLDAKRVVVWGAGSECAAVVGAMDRLGITAAIEIVDDSHEGNASVGTRPVKYGAEAKRALERADVIVRSPGVSRYRDDVIALNERGITFTTATNLWFAEEFDHVIGITGTKGKSTTASLLASLLSSVGENVALAGNIGRAPIDFLGLETPKWWVVELSSYQTSDLHQSPSIGVLTSLSSEHLDWHGDESTYRRDKLNMFMHNPEMQIVLNVTDRGVSEIADSLGGNVVRANEAPAGRVADGFFQIDNVPIAPTNAFQLLGRHNQQLASVALSVLQVAGIDIERNADAIAHSLTTFEPLSHRLEIYRELDGVTYVDDSISTTPAATLAALNAFDGRRITVLVGGHDRGLSYEDFARYIAQSRGRVNVVALPDSSKRIVEAIRAAGYESSAVYTADDLSEGVRIAIDNTPSGGVVLLSPGAPSFGRFRNYIERGKAFREAIDCS